MQVYNEYKSSGEINHVDGKRAPILAFLLWNMRQFNSRKRKAKLRLWQQQGENPNSRHGHCQSRNILASPFFQSLGNQEIWTELNTNQRREE